MRLSMTIAILTAGLSSPVSSTESLAPDATSLNELLEMVRAGFARACEAPPELRAIEFVQPERQADIAIASGDLRFIRPERMRLIVPSVPHEEIVCLLATQQVRTIERLDPMCPETPPLERLVSFSKRYNAVVQRARQRLVLDQCDDR